MVKRASKAGGRVSKGVAGKVVWNPRKDPVVNVGGCTKFKQKCTKSKISQKENKNQSKF
jgi:hypothetical protein